MNGVVLEKNKEVKMGGIFRIVLFDGSMRRNQERAKHEKQETCCSFTSGSSR